MKQLELTTDTKTFIEKVENAGFVVDVFEYSKNSALKNRHAIYVHGNDFIALNNIENEIETLPEYELIEIEFAGSNYGIYRAIYRKI